MATSETAMDETLQLYANPAMIQSTALDKLEEQVLGGQPVVDGNNVFTFLNEFNAQCTAGFATAVSKKFEALYPSRAQTFNDLYGHMSDWDYEGLYGYPSTTKIQLSFDRNFLINNAEAVTGEADYRKIVLPEFSTFKIGEYQFGIHYPIEIQIRMAYKSDAEGRLTGDIDYDACNITTQWDLTSTNPLCEYDTNILEHRNYISNGINLICIEVPVYQFVVSTTIDDAISNTGYLHKFDYTNRFYVMRIYHKLDGVWTEMPQSYSSIVYDPETLTALVKVYPDLNQVSVEIPQVYFTNGLVGNQIRVDIYTTNGAMNVDISSYTSDQFSASFVTQDDRVSDSKYSDMLKYISVCIVSPLSSKITDGNNGIDLTELKRRVVDRTEKNLLITADKITSYLSGRGFTARNYVDNITNRYYLAEKVIRDNDGVIISAGSFNTVFSSEDLATATDSETGVIYYPEHNTFKYIDEESFMILPNTIYLYDSTTNSAYPQNDEFMNNLSVMSDEEKVNLLNEGTYSFSPFHMKVVTNNSVPVASYYDLLKPEVTSVKFSNENKSTSTQISLYNSVLQHLGNGVGGYAFDILLYRTDDVADVPVHTEGEDMDNIYAMLRITQTDGSYAYVLAAYKGVSDDHTWMRFDLSTNYVITGEEKLVMTSFTSSASNVKVSLTQEFDLMFFIKKEYCPTGGGTKPEGIPSFLASSDYVWLATQNVSLKFGNATDHLLTTLYLEVEDETRNTYPTTEFSVYTTNLYKRITDSDVGTLDWKGDVITKDEVGIYKYPLEVVHEKGDVIISSDSDNLVPLGFTLNVINSYTTSEGLYVLSTHYTATSTQHNQYAKVEYRLPLTDDVGKYHYGIESKTAITSEDVLAEKKLYIETTKHDLNKTEDALTFIYTEAKKSGHTYDESRDLYTTIEDDVVSNPAQKQNFVYVKDDSEHSEITPENIFSDSTTEKVITVADIGKTIYINGAYVQLTNSNINDYVGQTHVVVLSSFGDGGAVYRSNPSVDISTYDELEYTDPDTGTQTFTPEKLAKIFEDMDVYPESKIIESWGITADTYVQLTKIRFPFFKVFVCENLNNVADYLNNTLVPSGENIAVKRLRELQESINNKVITFKNKAAFEAGVSALVDKAAYYVEDITGMTISTIFDDIEIQSGELKGALGVHEVDSTTSPATETNTWIISGGTKQKCLNEVNKINTFNGFAQLFMNDDGTDYYQFLSMREDDTLNLHAEELQWSLINHWPWELNDDTRIKFSTGLFTNEANAYMTTNTSATIAHQAGDLISEDGTTEEATDTPLENTESSRKLSYNVNMLHLDYKLLMSEEVAHQNYRSDAIDLIRSYFDTIDETRLRLLEGTNLYYSPVRTMGIAKFNSSNNEPVYCDLNLTLGFRIHVESYIASNTLKKETIRSTILSIVDENIASGTISCVSIASQIQEALSDMILHVDVLGVNDDQSLQTLLRSDNSTIPHLGYRLIINNDSSIGIQRSLDLVYSVIQ